jgi:PAS domain S-box-containing protein
MANNKICKMLGYAREEIFKLSIADLHPKESLSHVMEEFEKQVRGETEIASDLPVRRKDGSIFFADINSVLITISGKRLVLGMFRDVTARKQLEEKYRNLFENAQAGIFQSKIDGSGIIEINKKFSEILGYSKEELIGKPSTILWADPAEREKIVRQLKEKGFLENFEVVLAKKSGEKKTCLASTKIYPALGYIEGSLADITARKQAEEALKEKVKELEILHDATVERELKMEEMRKRIKELEEKIRGKK